MKFYLIELTIDDLQNSCKKISTQNVMEDYILSIIINNKIKLIAYTNNLLTSNT